MGPTAQLTAFAQSIYLTIKNRYFDDIDQEDGQTYIAQVIDWTNMFLDELENETGPDGQLVDWWFARASAAALGTATLGATSITMPTTVDHLITDEGRYVQVQVGGVTISSWAVVHPKDITNRTDRTVQDMCAIVGAGLVFSRAFRTDEAGGSIVGDVVNKLPRLSANKVTLLTTVRPKQLLILGVAKNATLPDIVQGGLSPSYTQKFNDLLQGAIARSSASSVASEVVRDDLSSVHGVY